MKAGVEGEVEAVVVVVAGGGEALAVVAAGSGDEAGGLRGVEPWTGARLVSEEKVCVMMASGCCCCETSESGAVWCQEKVEEVCSHCGPRSAKVGDVVKETTDSISSTRRSSQFNMVFPLITFLQDPSTAMDWRPRIFAAAMFFVLQCPNRFCFDNPYGLLQTDFWASLSLSLFLDVRVLDLQDLGSLDRLPFCASTRIFLLAVPTV
jgi:hypothetical protein